MSALNVGETAVLFGTGEQLDVIQSDLELRPISRCVIDLITEVERVTAVRSISQNWCFWVIDFLWAV
ncbi:hypothetical protein ACFFQF_31375 [Haladaptatus pallidirubidus]|uniref:hypothetical protein n=1 Tax=Haladaptatus pallidirubidus TaxID=1008152 RepID=UPI0035EF92E7